MESGFLQSSVDIDKIDKGLPDPILTLISIDKLVQIHAKPRLAKALISFRTLLKERIE